MLTGLLGMFWLIVWLVVYRPDRNNSHDSSLVQSGDKKIERENRGETEKCFESRWIDLFKYRQILELTFARFFEEPTAWFYLTWLPKYLVEFRHFQIIEMGVSLMVPFIFFGFWLPIGRVAV